MPAASSALASRAARTAASAVACALLALPAAADTPRAPGGPVLVLAAIPGADRIDARAIDLVAAHVRPLGVRLRIVRPGAPGPALQTLLPDARALAEAWDARGVLWIDTTSRGELALYVVERDGAQVYGRRIPVLPGQTAAALESLANIAGAVAEELREGRVAGLTKVDVAAAGSIPAAPPAPATASAPTTTPALAALPAAPAGPAPGPRPAAIQRDGARGSSRMPAVAVLAGYSGANFSDEAPWQSAAAFRASWAPVDRAVIGLGYELIPRAALSGGGLEFDLVRHPVITTGHVRLGLPFGFDLQLGARASFDVVQRIPQRLSRSPSAAPPPPFGHPPQGLPPQGLPPQGLPPQGLPPQGPPPPQGHAPWAQAPLRRPPWGWPQMAPRELPLPEAQTDVLVSVAPVAELGYPLIGGLRLKAMLGVDFLLTRPDASGHPGLALQPDPVRLLAGVGLELGFALGAPPAAAGVTER